MDSINIDKILSEKENNYSNKNVKDKVVRFTFYITYAFLMTTATVTFIEAIRTKDMKKVLQKANESHDEENKANDEARKKLSDGLEAIKDETIEDLNKARNDADKRDRQLKKDKKKFIEAAIDSETLAEDIANRIGADFVEKD